MLIKHHHLQAASLLIIGILWPPSVAYAEASEDNGPCDIVALQLENDAPAETDRNYTGGIRLACVTSPPQWLDNLDLMPVSEGGEASTRLTYSIGQSIYTPDDLDLAQPIDDDHPYAGWLYLGFGLESEGLSADRSYRHLDTLELQIGIVGPWSGAEQVQTEGHALLDATDPQGWGNQLDNEPGLNLFYSRQWTGAVRADLAISESLPGLAFDVTPRLGAALGNVHIFAGGGLTLRSGNFLPTDPGPAIARPGLAGSTYFPAQEGLSAYLFGSVEGRIVGRNIFLDGNSFQDDGPSVDKNALVGEGSLGFALTYQRFRLSYTHVYRTQEFDDQSPHIFGSLTLAISF